MLTIYLEVFFFRASVTMVTNQSQRTTELFGTPLLHAPFIVIIVVGVFVWIFLILCEGNMVAGSVLEFYDHIPRIRLYLELVFVLHKHHDLDHPRVVVWAEILAWPFD